MYKRTFNIILVTLICLFYSTLIQAKHSILPTQDQLEKIEQDYDQNTVDRFTAWDKLLKNSQKKSTIEKLQLVNTFFNQMKWVDDKELWDSKDYWATPIESLIKNAGDCEDYSIAKYYTLLELGVDVNQLRISYVKIKNFHQSHIVLAYYPTPKSDPLIMDNMKSDILKISQRPELEIKYEFNDEGLWSHSHPHTRLGMVSEIKTWAEMVQRMEMQKN
jgi:predicted transglutaminase-like cysteine proteinase